MSNDNMNRSASSPSSSKAGEYVREGVHVMNGTVVGAAIGGMICPVGGTELGAALGGWIGSKLSERSPSEKR